MMPYHVKGLEPNYNIDSLKVDATIQNNGDMLVKEAITLDGSFNGYIRDLSYKGNYSNYDASNLELIKVCESNNFTPDKCFSKVNYGYSGDSYVYEYSETSNIISLKMYDYNPSGEKTFYIEYLLKDVVLIHDDVAELYWTFIGENFDDDINYVNITINLPSTSTELRAWAHGPLDGNIDLVSKKQVVATINNLYAKNLVDVRMVFDKTLVSNGTKIVSGNGLNNILKEENKRADEANQERAKARMLYYGMITIDILWLCLAIIIFIYVYLKYDKERKSEFNLEYYREFPGEYGPEVMEYLITSNVSSLSLSALILNIVSKKGLTIREDQNKKGKKEYVLVDSKNKLKEPLTEEETFIKEWLLNDCGNGEEVSMNEIKDASKDITSAKKFLKQYNKWSDMAKENGQKEEFFDDNTGIKIKVGLFGALGIILFAIHNAIGVQNALMVIVLMVSIFIIIYAIAFRRRTVKGNDHYVKWMAFKKFLLDFGRFKEKELPEIALWEKYLVYATALGIADKVIKEMAIKIKEINADTNILPPYSFIYFNNAFAHDIVHTVSTAKTLSVSKIAQSRTSSGGGFGGGFSGGGGFGGGGIGGGGRGF
jgi:uncharacterized membrane protein